tara:strand:- start:43 stop:765 length:723 start_codon:yes stop_codon:yes gene_type:complete
MFIPFGFMSSPPAAPSGGWVTSGLVLNLMIYDASSYPGSGTAITDLSGNSLNGTINGTVSYNAPGYIDFNGTSNYVSVADNSLIDLSTAYTFDTLVFADDFLDRFRLIDKYSFSGGGTGYTWATQQANSGKLFSYVDSTLAGNALSPTAVSTGQYLNLTLTRDGNSTIMYLNGASFWNTTTGTTSAPTTNTDDLAFGRGLDGGGGFDFGKGRWAHGRIYDRALTPAEVLQNYNAIPAALQ